SSPQPSASNEASSAPAPSSPDTGSSSDSSGESADGSTGDSSTGDSSSPDSGSTSGDSGGDSSSPGDTSTTDEKKPPTIKHVWIVALTGHTMDEALTPNPSPMPYLAGTLRPKGLLLSKYTAVAPGGLANLIALISGQKPTADQQAGC